jgi:uncharacterized membrane protein
MITLKPTTRRLVYVSTYEFFAILLSALLLAILSGNHSKSSFPVAIAVSVIALIWNYVFNLLFEIWERRQQHTKRSVITRTIHACLFEAGLFLFTIPLYMLWYQVGLWQATKMEAAILIFFLFYTFLFTWLFDVACPSRLPQKI